MHTIDATELDAQLRRGANLQLLHVCSDGDLAAIEGSLALPAGIEPSQVLDRARHTVVYGCGATCEVAVATTVRLTADGFHDVRLFAGGTTAWRTAGRTLQH